MRLSICNNELTEYEECFVYGTVLVAKTGEYPHERSLRSNEIKGTVGLMLEGRAPGFTASSSFQKWSPTGWLSQLRLPRSPMTLRLKDKFSEQHIMEVSKFLEQYWDAHGHEIGPRMFNERGNMQKLVMKGLDLSFSHLSIIYTASKELLNSDEQPFTHREIQGMCLSMLEIKSLSMEVVEPYVQVFREMPYHWLTKSVANWTKGARLTAACEKAIALFEKSGNPGAHSKRDVASTTPSALVPSEHGDKGLSVPGLTQSLGSVNLGASVQPQNLRDTQDSSYGPPNPPAGQTNYHDLNDPIYHNQDYDDLAAPPQSQGPTWKLNTDPSRHWKPPPTMSAYDPIVQSSAAAPGSQGGSAQTMPPDPKLRRLAMKESGLATKESEESGETGHTHTTSGLEKKSREKPQHAGADKVEKSHGKEKKRREPQK